MERARRRCLSGLAAATLLAGACATTGAPTSVRAPPPRKAAAPSLRLAWMPLEPRVSPDVAAAVNERLARVVVGGVTDTFQAPVSMEMAQLAIECIERTPACYGAVGRSVGADRLLWAELAHARGAGTVTLRVSLFDVGGGTVVKEARRSFPSTKAASAGAAAVFDGAFGAAPGGRGSTP
jgi:hypothetical protein